MDASSVENIPRNSERVVLSRRSPKRRIRLINGFRMDTEKNGHQIKMPSFILLNMSAITTPLETVNYESSPNRAFANDEGVVISPHGTPLYETTKGYTSDIYQGGYRMMRHCNLPTPLCYGQNTIFPLLK